MSDLKKWLDETVKREDAEERSNVERFRQLSDGLFHIVGVC